MELTTDDHLRLLESMLRIRRFEETAGTLMEQGKMPGFLHLYVGEEAVAAGGCAALTDEDQITSTHRGHGHLIAKGGDFKRMMAEFMGRSTGYCKGKGGSMHVSDLDLGMLGANGIVGGGVPIEAAGVVIGALGVSGAPTPQADHECARAGLEAIADKLLF